MIAQSAAARYDGRRASHATPLNDVDECDFAIIGQSVPIFLQVVRSFLISARILKRRFESLRRRLRARPFGRLRRNISMTC